MKYSSQPDVTAEESGAKSDFLAILTRFLELLY